MKSRYEIAAKVLLSTLIIAGISAVVCNYKFYVAFADAVFAFTVLSFVILYLRVCPKWSTVLTISSLGLVFAAIEFGIFHYPARPMVWISLFGLSAFTALPVHGLWTSGERRRSLFLAFFPFLPFVVLGFFMSSVLDWFSRVHPKTLDLYLLSFDCSLHIQLSFLFGQVFARSLFFAFTGWAFYMALPIPMAVVYAGQLVKVRKTAFEAISAFLIAGPLGMIFYHLFPAAGPHNLFGAGFPFHVFPMAAAPKLLLEPIAPPGPRNAMPSLHLTWVLLAWWYSRKLSPIERAIAFLFLGLTAFATLGTGEHWLADLVVAFPFALMIQAICAYQLPIWDPRRRTAFIFGLLATLTWLLLFRYGTRLFWTSPIVPWGLIAATLALTVIRQRVLDAGPTQASKRKWWEVFLPGAAPAGGTSEEAVAVQEVRS